MKPRIGATTIPRPVLVSVARQRRRELGSHPYPERLRPDDLTVAAVLHDVHDQLAVIGVGHAQLVAAVRDERALLVLVPALGGDPARPFRREAQYRPGDALAGEDAVARSQHFVEALIGDIQGARVEDLGVFDGVDREGAQAVPQMAPGVEVPVAAVVVEALRRDLAFRHLVGAARMVADQQALSPQQGGADALEVVQVQFARTDRLDADAALHLLGRVVGAAEQAGEPGEQGPDLRPEQAAGVEVREEMMHGQQRMDFLGAEPQPGQLIVRADPLSGLLEAVAAQVAVEADRRVQAVAHVGEVALERGPGDAETFQQLLAGDAVARAENLVDLVNPLHVVHGKRPEDSSRNQLHHLGVSKDREIPLLRARSRRYNSQRRSRSAPRFSSDASRGCGRRNSSPGSYGLHRLKQRSFEGCNVMSHRICYITSHHHFGNRDVRWNQWQNRH